MLLQNKLPLLLMMPSNAVILVMSTILKSFPPVPIRQPFPGFEAEHCADACAQLQVGRTQQTWQAIQVFN